MKNSEYKKIQNMRCYNCNQYKTCEDFMRGSESHPECFEEIKNDL